MESLCAFLEQREHILCHARGAGSHSFLQTAGCAKGNAGDAVIEQLAQKSASAQTGITDCEEETIAHLLGDLAVINNVKAVGTENLLHLLGTARIFLRVGTEI